MDETDRDGLSIDGDRFVVVVNGEGQHALWPARKTVPAGWRQAGPAGSRSECLAYVEAHWVDMRPISLRQVMEHSGSAAGAASVGD